MKGVKIQKTDKKISVKLKKGIDLPITGVPSDKIIESKTTKVAIIADEYKGMKPSMKVKVGDTVKKGQLLFEDKKIEGIRFTSIGAGKVIEINRGERRAFQSIVIELKGDAEVKFDTFNKFEGQKPEKVKEFLNETGLWTSFRARPFGRTAVLTDEPSSIFITAMDSDPLSGSAEQIIGEQKVAFENGLKLISSLAKDLYLCKYPNEEIPGANVSNVTVAEFEGPHPAGLPGTHIHFIDPVWEEKTVWQIGYQDVIAIGNTAKTGGLYTDRIVALSGPSVTEPCLVKTQMGACLSELTAGKLSDGENRVISGSVLNGINAQGVYDYLTKFTNQVSVIKEDKEQHFMGWSGLGSKKFSLKNVWFANLLSLFSKKKFAMTSQRHGNPRSMVPVGSFEKVMPLDIMPTFLLRSLVAFDTEGAQNLGALELIEEDLALCTFASPGKADFGEILRENLTKIEKEG